MTRWCSLAFAVLSLSAFAAPRPAAAQTVPTANPAAPSEAVLATRREVLNQATAAAREGRHMEAIELAERAGRIHMTISVRMFLAEEHEAIDDHAAAYAAASACLADGQRDLAAANRELILDRCRVISTNSRGRLVALTVQVPAPRPAALVVRVNGQAIPEEVFGLPYFVNPGSIVVEATGQGRRAFRWEDQGVAAEEVAVTVNLVEEGAPLAAGHTAANTATTVRRRRRAAPAVSGPPSVAGPVALVALGGALEVTAAVALALHARAWDGCARVGSTDQALCDTPEQVERARSIGTWVGLGWGAFAGGLVSAGAGLGWYFATHRGAERRPPVSAQPVVSGDFVGAAVRGRF